MVILKVFLTAGQEFSFEVEDGYAGLVEKTFKEFVGLPNKQGTEIIEVLTQDPLNKLVLQAGTVAGIQIVDL